MKLTLSGINRIIEIDNTVIIINVMYVGNVPKIILIRFIIFFNMINPFLFQCLLMNCGYMEICYFYSIEMPLKSEMYLL